jgi:hypothetical protein
MVPASIADFLQALARLCLLAAMGALLWMTLPRAEAESPKVREMPLRTRPYEASAHRRPTPLQKEAS